MFTRIHLDLATVTPAFIGGVDPQHAEWSGKGVRGELRWWLRAVAGGVYQGDAAKTREIEQSLFGAAEESSPIRILTPGIPPIEEPGSAIPGPRLDEKGLAEEWGYKGKAAVERRLRLQGATNPIGYLGYGPIGYVPREGSKYLRARIPEKTPLRLILQRRPRGPSNDAVELFGRALWCWLHLGGIGGRSRRGFGSLTATKEIDADSFGRFPPLFLSSVEALRKNITNILSDARRMSGIAEWTHFTSATRIYTSKAFPTWDKAMVAAGAWLIAFRRRYGIVDDERAGVKNHDYQWFRDAEPKGIPDRAGFGLPLPFGKDPSVVVGWGETKEGRDKGGRRASPLLIHVSRFGNDHHIVFTHIPARLVPEKDELHFRGLRGKPTKDQEGIVQVFLDDLKTRGLVEVIV